MKAFFISLFITCILSAASFAEDILLHLNKNKISFDEPLSITFSTSHQIKQPPDFSPLEIDFTIISHSQDKSISIINGKMMQESRWHLVLMGKHPGHWTIPSIKFDQYRSSPKSIEITEAMSAKQDDAIFLETEISPEGNVYEQSLLTYTVRLFCSVKLAQATLTDLTVSDKDAVIERIGEDREYDHTDPSGKHYRVYERKYAISPQHAGELIFYPLVFEGALLSGTHSFFELPAKIKRLQSGQKTATILPIPSPFHKNNWLASDKVALTEDWSIDPANATLGEPMTRTIKITALGCLGNQIPDLPSDYPNSFKHYLDKPEASTFAEGDRIVGTKEIKVVLIPTHTGEITLPKMTLPWWDINANEAKMATLPERTIRIRDSAVALANAPTQALSKEMPEESHLQQEPLPKQEQDNHLILFLLAGSFFVTAACLLAFFIKKKLQARHSDSFRHLKKRLKKACLEGRAAKEAEECLLIWFKKAFPKACCRNILDIKKSVPENFQKAIDELYQNLYGKAANWNGEELFSAYCAFKPPRHKNKEKKGSFIKELYTEI